MVILRSNKGVSKSLSISCDWSVRLGFMNSHKEGIKFQLQNRKDNFQYFSNDADKSEPEESVAIGWKRGCRLEVGGAYA